MSLQYALELDGTAAGSDRAAPGVFVSVRPTSERWARVVEERYRVRPRVSLIFDVDKFELRDLGVQTMLSEVARVLRDQDGDAVMLFEGETALLVRRGGRLELSDNPFWTPDLRAMVEPCH
ncbi:MAG: SitI3 family protein [Candidatus Eremiobacterota bacterium]